MLKSNILKLNLNILFLYKIYDYYILQTLKTLKFNKNTSISRLKSHLGRSHQKTEFLTDSQKQQKQPSFKHQKIPKQLRNELHQKAIDAVINDSL